MDFSALIKDLQSRTHKIHGRYECSKCGEKITYVMLMPDHMLIGHNTRSMQWCRGKLNLLCKIIIPKGHKNY